MRDVRDVFASLGNSKILESDRSACQLMKERSAGADGRNGQLLLGREREGERELKGRCCLQLSS